MSSLKDDNFSEEQSKLISAIQEGFKKTIKPLTEQLNYIYQSLVDQKLIEPLAVAESLKQITQKGNELLEKYNVNSYIDENCPLLRDEKLKENTDPQIFIKAKDWVEKKEGKEKLNEIILNTNFPESLVKELLALAVLYKIKKLNPNK